METKYQNILEGIQGKWKCTEALNKSAETSIIINFALLISENIISRSGDGEEYWPSICSFESVGALKDGYLYREDGCFLQIKLVTEETLAIELAQKNNDGTISTFNFSFERILD